MKISHNYYVYILTNKSNKVLYIGVTNDLRRRVYEHRSKLAPSSFTAKYNVTKLVYYEHFTEIDAAIKREKQLKSGNRKRKIELITIMNAAWKDLYLEI